MKIFPFPGLTQEHYHFSCITQILAVDWRASALRELRYEFSRWIFVLAAFVFFAIFGSTEESCTNYRDMLQSVVQVFIKITVIKSPPSSKAEGSVISFFFLFSV